MSKIFTTTSLKKTLMAIANDNELSKNLMLYSLARFAKKTHKNSVNYHDDNAIYFLDKGNLLIDACIKSIGYQKIDEEDIVLIMNIYGHMIKKHKYSADYKVISKNMGSFCKKLANVVNDYEIPKTNSIIEVEEHICKIIDKLLARKTAASR